jgi:hypothetical protein
VSTWKIPSLRQAALISFALGLAGCETLNSLIQFNLPLEFKVVVPSTLNVGLPIDVLTPDIESNATARFETEGTRADLVESATLTEMTLQLVLPAGEDFSFLEQIDVYISADGVGEALMATSGQVAVNAGSTLSLNCTDLDLKAYLISETFDVRIRTVTDELTTQDMEVDVDCVFRIDAELI